MSLVQSFVPGFSLAVLTTFTYLPNASSAAATSACCCASRFEVLIDGPALLVAVTLEPDETVVAVDGLGAVGVPLEVVRLGPTLPPVDVTVARVELPGAVELPEVAVELSKLSTAEVFTDPPAVNGVEVGSPAWDEVQAATKVSKAAISSGTKPRR